MSRRYRIRNQDALYFVTFTVIQWLDIIRDIKKFTSVKIIEAIKDNPQESRRDLLLWLFSRLGKMNTNNVNNQFWQQHNHSVELATNEMIDERLHYVHNNPVAAGVVLSAEDYLYSSAINYAGLPEKLIDVILL